MKKKKNKDVLTKMGNRRRKAAAAIVLAILLRLRAPLSPTQQSRKTHEVAAPLKFCVQSCARSTSFKALLKVFDKKSSKSVYTVTRLRSQHNVSTETLVV